jgi:serine phosphatase RsbU (regulator of sigma subunit)
MSLRLRLIVAFFLLSVVPLGAFTFYSYTSNVRAVRDAAARESDLLAGELSQRMQLVTAQLTERVEHLMDLQSMQTSGATSTTQVAQVTTTKSKAPAKGQPAAAAPATSTTPMTTAASPTTRPATAAASTNEQIFDAKVAQALGEAAMLLNNVELRGMRDYGRQGGRSPSRQGGAGGGAQGAPPPSGMPRPSPSATPPHAAGTIVPPPPGAIVPPTPTSTPTPAGEAPRGGPGTRGGQQQRSRSGGRTMGAPPAPIPPGEPTVPQPGQPPPTPGALPVDASRLMIDLAPIRREIFKQIVPEGHLENLTPEERQRVNQEVSQRLLGIVQGLQLGAAGLQKKAADAEREAAAAQAKSAETAAVSSKAAETGAKAADVTAKTQQVTAKTSEAAAQPAPAPTSTPAAMKKKTEISGSHLGVTMEQNGQVVEQISAEINMPEMLATVFSTTRRDRGEIPFAVGKDGKIYAPTDDDRKAIEAMNLPAPPEGQASSTITKGNWIIVTNAGPPGSGLRFGIAKPVGNLLSELRKTAATNASLGLGFIGLALIGIVPLSGRLTRNLSKLTEGVDRIAHGDYSARVPLKATDEIGRLATAFNRMAADVEEHQRAAVQQERVKRELELGRQIQNEMLPHESLRFGLTEVKGVSVPAREVGGDFFNYFELPNHHIALLVGDVSGKGVGAALLMANIQASLRTRLALGQDLSAIAEAIDRDVDANSPGPVYATLFVGILDPVTRRFRYVNAGHHPQYALCRQGLERMPSTGLPVGLLSGRGYTAREVQLSAGDLLFFYTDGLVEAENAAGDMFGPERLEAILAASAASSPDDVLQHVEQAVNSFRGKAEPFDDETMMAVKVG